MTKYGDIKLYFHPNQIGDYADIKIEDGDFVREEGLFTAVLMSLFSDVRVDPKDSYNGESRGFWGDELLGFNLGSRLWLLGRSNLNNKTYRLAEQYTTEALQWMIDEEVATEITASASRTDDNKLLLKIVIKGPGADDLETFRFKLEWIAQLNEVA